jgi:hypothetical protein
MRVIGGKGIMAQDRSCKGTAAPMLTQAVCVAGAEGPAGTRDRAMAQTKR